MNGSPFGRIDDLFVEWRPLHGMILSHANQMECSKKALLF